MMRLFAVVSLWPCLADGFSFQAQRNSRLSVVSSARSPITENADASSGARRALLVSSSALLVGTMKPFLSTNTAAPDPPSGLVVRNLDSVGETLQIIEGSCDRTFLHAVVASEYNFLYRGITSEENKATVEGEQCDLLLEGTYGSADAMKFFQKLDTKIMVDDPVRPSNGHLATTSSKAASQWGNAASIWPLVDGPESRAHFAWFEEGGLFWPRDDLDVKRSDIIVDGRDCGRDNLEDALRSDNLEVMFCADSFLAVPAKFDDQLRAALKASFVM